MDAGKQEVFINLCKSQYEFEPDHKNIKAIAEKLGAQKNSWKYVWQLYATAPHKYLRIEELLRLAKPADLGSGGCLPCPKKVGLRWTSRKKKCWHRHSPKWAKQDAAKPS